MNKFLFLLVFLGQFSENLACNDIIYLIPIFESRENVSNANLTMQFLDSCKAYDQNIHTELDLLVQPYAGFKNCEIRRKEGDCRWLPLSEERVTLEEMKTYKIAQKMFNHFVMNIACKETSIAIILTDIPCQNFDRYPDMQLLFGDFFNQTANRFNEKIKLHTVVFWIKNDTDQTMQCKSSEKYNSQNPNNYLELQEITKDEIVAAGRICNPAFNINPGDTRPVPNHQVNTKTNVILIIVFVLIAVVLFIALIATLRAIYLIRRKMKT